MPRKIRIGRVDDFAPGEMTEVSVEGTSLVVVRDEQGVCAARNRCPHLGLSLTKGPGGRSYDDGVVQCPWHNSKFVVRTGENLDWVGGVAGRSVPRWSRRVIAAGRKPAPLTTYPVLVEGDQVFIEM
jgi:nitrite reductase/ring-hydroxylating ferredoxin subunit